MDDDYDTDTQDRYVGDQHDLEEVPAEEVRPIFNAPTIQDDRTLQVDMFQTEDSISVKANIAGVPLEDVDIRITRDSVTIRGNHEEEHLIATEDYYHKELIWGTFGRVLTLPEEIDDQQCDAISQDGILTIVLPKLNSRETKLNIRKG